MLADKLPAWCMSSIEDRDRIFEEQLNRLKMFYNNRVKEGNGRASDCLACGQCESVCPQHLPIIKLMQEATRLFDE